MRSATQTVGIAELKSRLSEYLRRVRRGHPITILDRETPIARIVPYEPGPEPLPVRRPASSAPRLADVALPPPLRLDLDIVDLLLEERQGGPMNAYVDSSVVLRMALQQDNALGEWKQIETGVASALVEVECLRTLDRLRVSARAKEADIAVRREAVYRLMESMEIVDPSPPVLRRASQPFPTALGTLDAIHLATAILWRERAGQELYMATHDSALGLAARASGLLVLGI